jgi:Fe2+ or Zn2+ uptake regulation protein
MEPLTEREVNDILNTFSPEKQEFLSAHLKQGKKSKWLEVLSQKKGIPLSEGMTDEEIEEQMESWVLKEVLDGGFGNKPFRCECGTPLRYQYIVYHSKEKKTYKLGVTCLENYTNLSPELISDIKKGFHTIDLERDEILTKYQRKQFFPIEKFIYIEDLPEDIVHQTKIGLPLTDRQIAIVYTIKKEYDKNVQTKKVLEEFSDAQKTVYDVLPRWKKEEVVQRFIDRDGFNVEIPEEFQHEEIQTFKEIDFPLLEHHLFKLNEYLNARRNQEQILLSRQKEMGKSIKITYDEIIRRHLVTLKKVREKEQSIPRGLQNDWVKIQQQVRGLKEEQGIEYSSFKLNLSMLVFALKIEPDPFL